MTSEFLIDNEILYNLDYYRIEEAACLWLSVNPNSIKGNFLKEFGKLRRARSEEECRRRELPKRFGRKIEER